MLTRMSIRPIPKSSQIAIMFTSSIFVAVSALAALTQAQYLPNAVFDGQNYSVSGPIAVVPSSVDAGNSSAWCLAQRNSCPQICGSLATNNTCDTVSGPAPRKTGRKYASRLI